MDLGLEGKHVLVTGGSRGIGLAAATEFAREGAHVAIVGRTQRHLRVAMEGLEGTGGGHAFAIAADLGTPDGVDAVVQRVAAEFPSLDVLVNCAGDTPRGRIGELSDQDWDGAFALKFLAAVRLIRALAPKLAARKGSSIVNVAGLAGWQPGPDSVAIGSVNSALLNLGRSVSRDLATRGVRINTVVPGVTRTDRLESRLERESASTGRGRDEILRLIETEIPLGRISEPGDVAAAIVFLASDAARQITGAAMEVDGGADRGVH